MSGFVEKFKKGNLVILLVLVVALAYLAFLTSSIHNGVFYSADGGVKYMTVKQLSEGHGFKYLYLPQPSWVSRSGRPVISRSARPLCILLPTDICMFSLLRSRS